MNPKDRFDAINGITANVLAATAITIAIRQRPKHKKQNRFQATLPADPIPSETHHENLANLRNRGPAVRIH